MNIVTEIDKNFKNSIYNIVILNKRMEKDIDIVFYTNDLDRENTYLNVKDFIERIKNTSIPDSFFLLHDHRNFGSKKKLIHLLYYPSIYFLKFWELPSFQKSIFDTSQVIRGNKNSLKSLAEKYVNRKPLKFDLYELHLAYYAQIAIHNLLYTYFGSDIYSKDTIIENLTYIYKYYFIEILYKNHPQIDLSVIWDWKNFTNIFGEYYSHQNRFIELFKKKCSNSLQNIERHEIIEYYFEFIKIISNKNPEPFSNL